MLRLRLLLLLIPAVISLSGCAGGNSNASVPDANNVDANGQAVSSVPWNKPESWETDGQMGSMSGH